MLSRGAVRVSGNQAADAAFWAMSLAFVVWFWTRFQRKGLRDLGFRPRLEGLAGGLLAGSVGVGLVLVASLLLRWAVRIPEHPWPAPTTWAMTALLALGTAVLEETLFRGILLRSLLMTMTWPTAMGTSALLFAAAHFLGPGGQTTRELATTFLGLWATGLTLAWAALRRGLWFPVGVHACWIVAIVLSAQANPYAFPVECHMWTGNGFPPRGLLGILAMLGLVTLLGRPTSSDVAVAGNRGTGQSVPDGLPGRTDGKGRDHDAG